MSKYGCWNAERKAYYYSPQRSLAILRQSFDMVAEKVLNTMTRECRYDQRANDAKCEGCRK